MTRLSKYFYKISGLWLALASTAIFVLYVIWVMQNQAAGFAVENSAVTSLGTKLGFNRADIMAFVSERSPLEINNYIHFSRIWDSLFAVIYGAFYVIWLSLLFKPFQSKTRWLNLIPFAQTIFDWIENFAVASIMQSYLDAKPIPDFLITTASTANMLKWFVSAFITLLLIIGIVARLVLLFRRKR